MGKIKNLSRHIFFILYSGLSGLLGTFFVYSLAFPGQGFPDIQNAFTGISLSIGLMGLCAILGGKFSMRLSDKNSVDKVRGWYEFFKYHTKVLFAATLISVVYAVSTRSVSSYEEAIKFIAIIPGLILLFDIVMLIDFKFKLNKADKPQTPN